MFRMVWNEAMPEADAFPDAVRLGPQHAAGALELAQLTNPGPFGPRTLERSDFPGHLPGSIECPIPSIGFFVW